MATRRSCSLAVNARIQKGKNFNLLFFTVAENQTAVGSINESGSTFTITSGSDIFNIDSNGVITFKSAPDFETISSYKLQVTSSKGKQYSITVYATEVLSSFALNISTALNLSTAL